MLFRSVSTLREQCPDNARVFVGKGYRCNILMTPTDELHEPILCVLCLALSNSDHRASAVNQ